MNFLYIFRIGLLTLGIVSAAQAQRSIIDSLRRVLQSEVEDSGKISLFIQLGDMYKKLDPDSNRYFTERALELVKNQVKGRHSDQYRISEGHYHFRIGEAYHQQKKHEKAVEYYHKSIKSFEQALKSNNSLIVEEAKKGVINGYFFLGRVFAEKENSDKAIEFYNESIRLRQEISDFYGIARCHNNIGIVYYYQGNFDKAIESYDKSIKIREQINDKDGISNCYINMGVILTDQGKFEKAIESYLNALKIKEELQDQLGIAHCYNNIGNLLADQDNTEKAIEYYQKALKIRVELDDKEGISGCYTNIGLANSELKDYNKAIEYYQKAIPIYTDLDDEMGLADNFNNLGIAYTNKKEHQKAIGYFEKSLIIREKLGDSHGVVAVTANIASLHLSLAESFEKSGSNQKVEEHKQLSLKYGTRAMEMSKNIGAIPQQKGIAENLIKTYKAVGNTTKALYYAELSIELRDTLFKDERTKALAEMESRYNAEKKQQEIENKTLQIENQHLAILHAEWETRKQRVFVFILFLAFVLVVVFAFYIHKSNIKQIETNKLLQQYNAEILQQKEEIVAQSEEIDSQNKKITNSIEYAGLIQQSVLTDAKSIEAVFKEYFLFYKPCEIVSGDFYLIRQNESSIYIAIADCTGHGVPGALISMLGYAFLNEIIHRKISAHANLALEEMRANVKSALNQTGKKSEQDDGIEIAFCIINKATRKLSYSGANIPLWLVRHEDNEMDPILEILKPDLQPVGIHPRENPFSEKSVQLYEGDIIYIFTNGFTSQFGEPMGNQNQLKEIILSNSHLILNEQKEILERNFLEWKTSNEQTDDILAFGVKI